MVKSMRHLRYSDRLSHLKLPSLLYCRRRGEMITVYQLIHRGMDVPPVKFLSMNSSRLNRGHPWKLHKPRARSLARRNALSSQTAND